MSGAVSLGDIARARGADLLASSPVSAQQRKVLRSVADCRTDALGGHRDRCDRCGYEHLFWNSCRDRHCPGCGSEARERWLDARRGEVLDVPYFHVVFTLPEQLRPLAQAAPAIIYAILLRSAAETLLDVAARRLKAILGIMAILHTWNQLLLYHPHAHCVVPGGGLSLDGQRWKAVPNGNYLFHTDVLAAHFETIFRNAVCRAFDDGSLILPTTIAADRTRLDLLFAQASKTKWHVYVKPPFGGPEKVLAYLSNYTHRIAISNYRIKGFDHDNVTFSYRDRHAGDLERQATIPAVDFLQRYLLHVVPLRFTRIRYYGFLANRDRAQKLALARRLIASIREVQPRTSASNHRRCPQCRTGTMLIVERVQRQRSRTWFDSS